MPTLSEIWTQITDPRTWPPPPERKLVPVTAEDLRAMAITAEELIALVWRPAVAPQVAGDAAPVERG